MFGPHPSVKKYSRKQVRYKKCSTPQQRRAAASTDMRNRIQLANRMMDNDAPDWEIEAQTGFWFPPKRTGEF